MSLQSVTASFSTSAMIERDEELVDQAKVTRSEAAALVDRFWDEVEAARRQRGALDGEINLCLYRDLDHHVLEFAVFEPAVVEGRHDYPDRWTLLWLIPMNEVASFVVDCPRPRGGGGPRRRVYDHPRA